MIDSAGLVSGCPRLVDDKGVVHRARRNRREDALEEFRAAVALQEAQERAGVGEQRPTSRLRAIAGTVVSYFFASVVPGWVLADMFGLKGWLPVMALGVSALGLIIIWQVGWVTVRRRLLIARETGNQRSKRSRRMEREIREWVGRCGRCAVCGYAIFNLESDADGFKACPECGASWRHGVWANDGCDDLLLDNFVQACPTPLVWINDGREQAVPVLARRARRDILRMLRELGRLRGAARFADELVAVAFLSVLTAVIMLLSAAGGMPPQPTASLFVFVAVTWAVIYGLIRIAGIQTNRRRRGRRLARAFISKNLCPCCESALRATSSLIDTCLLCDTCGSAWDPPCELRRPEGST